MAVKNKGDTPKQDDKHVTFTERHLSLHIWPLSATFPWFVVLKVNKMTLSFGIALTLKHVIQVRQLKFK